MKIEGKTDTINIEDQTHIDIDVDFHQSSVPSPLATVFIVWFTSAVLVYFKFIDYSGISFDFETIAFLASCLVLFTFGYLFGGWLPAHNAHQTPDGITRSVRTLNEIVSLGPAIDCFALAGIASAVLFTYEMLFLVGVSPIDLLDARSVWSDREVTIFSQLAAVLGAGGYFALIALILGWSQLPSRRKALWLTSGLSLSLFSLFSGGRQTVFQLALIAIISFWFRDRPQRFRFSRIAMASIIVVATISFGMLVASARSGTQSSLARKEYLLVLFSARFSPEVEALQSRLPPQVQTGVTELLLYLTHSIPMFSEFYSLPDPRPGPYLGLWELPFLARRLDGLGLTDESVSTRVNAVSQYFSMSGRSPNSWQTALRDLIIDFGEIGTLLFVAVFGFTAGYVHYKSKTEGGIVWDYTLVGINLLCAYSLSLSIISDTIVFFYFLGIVVIHLLYRYSQYANVHYHV